MRTITAIAVATLLLAVVPVHGQEKKEAGNPAVFKVEFNIHDGSDAAAKAGRRYAMLIDTTGKGTIKIGSRVPVATGSFQPGAGGGGNALVNTQYQYFEVGVNIDCSVHEAEGKVALRADLDVSTMIEHDRSITSNPPAPTISQIRLSVYTMVNAGKPTMVGSIDDPLTGRKFDVETTVTKVN